MAEPGEPGVSEPGWSLQLPTRPGWHGLVTWLMLMDQGGSYPIISPSRFTSNLWNHVQFGSSWLVLLKGFHHFPSLFQVNLKAIKVQGEAQPTSGVKIINLWRQRAGGHTSRGRGRCARSVEGLGGRISADLGWCYYVTQVWVFNIFNYLFFFPGKRWSVRSLHTNITVGWIEAAKTCFSMVLIVFEYFWDILSNFEQF